MGTEILLAVLSWLAITEATANVVSIAPVRYLNNQNAGTVSRLYRNVPVGVYAGALPYAAYSFNVPTFVAPKNANQNIIPLNEDSVSGQSSQGFLRDSYGQKYQAAPQSIAYRTTLPQQYVQLQNLPAHLSQPLMATSPNFQFRQVTPHFFGSSQFGVPNVQSFSPTLINRFVQSPQLGVSQPHSQPSYSQNIKNAAPQQSAPLTSSQIIFRPSSQFQSPPNRVVHTDNHTSEKYSSLKSEPKQQQVNAQPVQRTPEIIEQNAKQSQQSIKKEKLKRQRDPVVTTHENGETIVTIPTKPNLPLLDLSLLEPLTFDNPLVPQVQHFLPRINQATYHKLPNVNQRKKHKMEFIVQKTKSYDSTQDKSKPKKDSPKKKQAKPRPHIEHKDEEDDNPVKSVTVVSTPNESPEISYEINSPNYKETYTEKKVQYNKETQSEPVHYNYEKQTQKEPVHYSYAKHTQNEPVHYSYTTSSKEPGKIEQIIYSNKEEPRQLIFHFKPEDAGRNYEKRVLSTPQTESEGQYNGDSSDSEKTQEKVHTDNNNQNENQFNAEIISDYNNVPRENDEKNYHEPQYLKSTTAEYEEDITILPTYQPQTSSNFNENLEQEKPHNKHNSHDPTEHYHSSYTPYNTQYGPQPVVHEKSKRIIIKEESPDESSHPDGRQLMEEMVKQQEESENDFENAYKNAAYGFPAFDAPSVDVEKEIYNPESYGASKYHSDFDIVNTPLQQYQVQGDDYPSHTRSNYKDERDKMQEEYYLDYAISRPESILDRYKNKEDYYKMFAKHKPEKYFGEDEEKKKSEKYTFAFQTPQKIEQKQKSAPYVYEYKLAKETPRDNSAFATRPVNHRYKSKTQFVEPQYQYGSEPISIPHLLDSELAAMASNENAESENPGTRKKLYKENWYIKKTTTSKAR